MLFALALLALAQDINIEPAGIDGPIFSQASGSTGGLSPAAFEFANASGTGMGAACACTTPTGTRGEVLTYTRASSGTCMKGSTLTNIANGDLVTCTANQPAVMRGNDGTGPLGLLAEPAATNLALRSEAFDNVAWTGASSGSSNPIVTADAAPGPDANTTADRVQFGACAASTNISIIFQTALGTSGANTGSVFCRGTSVSQTISVCAFDDGANAGTCTQVTCPATSWTRTAQTRTVAATTGGLVIGCNNGSNYTGGASTGTADVLLSGGQYEVGAYASSYIKTVGAAATRTSFNASFAYTITAGGLGSFGATFTAPAAVTDGIAYVQALIDANNLYTLQSVSLKNRGNYRIGGANSFVSSAGSIGPSTSTPLSGYYDGVNQGSCVSGVCTTAGASLVPPSGAATVYIGINASGAGNEAGGVIKKVCLDPSSTRCR